MKYSTKYAVICRLVDCEEDWGLFTLNDDSDKPLVFSRIADARRVMKDNYKSFSESYDAEWSCDGKDHCKRNVRKDEISIDVPIYDAENEKDSWIVARWSVVGL